MKDYEAFHQQIENFQIFNVVPKHNDIYYTVVDESGKRHDIVIKDFRPYFYIPKNKIRWHKPFLTENEVKKIVVNHPAQVRKERENHRFTYEADLLYDIRFNLDMDIMFYKKKAKQVPFHIWFADIEVFRNFKEGNPDFRNDTNIVNAISFYDTILDKYFSIVVIPPKSNYEIGKVVDKNKILIKVKNEEKLFEVFLYLLNKLKPVLITGWNFINFDMTYMIQRLKEKYPEMLNLLSPYFNKEPVLRLNEENSNDIFIPGLAIVDLQLLYRKFTTEKKDSYTLNFIAQDELGESKVDYIGSLDELWINNFEKFLQYSYKDVELLVQIEEKRQFIPLINELKEISGIPLYYFNFNHTLKFNDGLIIKYIRTKLPKRYVVKSKSRSSSDYQISGGYVRVPKIGFHNWVIDLDASSMYPSGMLSYNISPETFLGRVFVDIKDVQNYIRPYLLNRTNEIPERLRQIEFISQAGETKLVSIDRLKEAIYKVTDKFCIAPNGSIFNLNITDAVIPTIQKDLKSKRKRYKDLMKIWKIFSNLVNNEL